MTIFSLIITIVIVGVALFVVNRAIPMDANIKMVLNVVVILLLVLWVADAFVDLGTIGHTRIRAR